MSSTHRHRSARSSHRDRHSRSCSHSPRRHHHSKDSRENRRQHSSGKASHSNRHSGRHSRNNSNKLSSQDKRKTETDGKDSNTISGIDCGEEIRRVLLVQKQKQPSDATDNEARQQQQPQPADQPPSQEQEEQQQQRVQQITMTTAASTAAVESCGKVSFASQIRVSEATRRLITDGMTQCEPSATIQQGTVPTNGLPSSTSSFGTFGRPKAHSRKVPEDCSSESRKLPSSEIRKTSPPGRSGSRKRSRSRSRSSSDISVRRSDSSRLKIDKQRLRRKAIENTVQRLDERCPRRLAEMPCFKALGVRVSELERICRKLAKTSSNKDQDERNKEYRKIDDRLNNGDSDTIGPSVRHPFQLRPDSDSASRSGFNMPRPASTATAASRFGESKVGQKQQLLAAFPVSSGEFHRTSDEVEGKAESSTEPQTGPQSLVASSTSAGSNVAAATAAVAAAAAPQSVSAHQKDCLLSLADWAAAKPQPQIYQQLQQQTRSKSPQAWVKKHQLLNAQPITGGIGHHLMQKMGWRDGQGLGKRNEGPTEPLAIDYKADRKGLASHEDRPFGIFSGGGGGGKKKKHSALTSSTAAAVIAASKAAAKAAAAVSGTSLAHLDGKHPICALLEAVRKRRLPEPEFRLVHQSGPAHSPCFVFCVKIGSVEYQPTRPCKNKKDAKACAATIALQELGIVPKQ